MVRDFIRVQAIGAERTPAKPGGAQGKSATVRILEGRELPDYQEAWSRLSVAAVVPNAFYEPWMLLPALSALASHDNVRFLLVSGPAGRDGTEPLWGFFPLELQLTCLNLPIRTLAFWQHRWCYLTTPLVDKDHIREVLESFWRWFEHNPFGCRIMDTNYLISEGRFHGVWADFSIGRTSFMLGDFPRAFLEPFVPAASYIARAMSKKHYDEFLRQERRLAELGKLEYRQVKNLSQVDAWVQEFLLMEARGWKGGPEGKAFAKQSEDSSYLRTITRDGFTENRVMLLSLTLDGKTIAMKHNVLSSNGGFAFRIAFDEAYAKFSPGVQLEFENIRRVCGDPRIAWFDSCAAPRHLMANRIWSERRMIRRTLFSDGSRLGDFVVSLLPLLRWIKKQVRPKPIPSHFQVSTRELNS